MMRRLLLCLMLLPLSALAAPPRVVASIAPLHSIAAQVMQDIAEPALLVPAGASPHDYALRPSDASALQQAALVIWVGPELETFLSKPLEQLAGQARVLALLRLDGLSRLPAREGGLWQDAHGQGDHHHAQAHGAVEAHIWLDPDNAAVIADAVAAELSALDPANAARYRDNARRFRARLTELDAQLRAQLAPVRSVPYLVFHDAYQYFEQHYGLSPAGAVTVNPEQRPGGRRLAELRALVERNGVRCVFREPQFQPSLVEAITRGTPAKVGVLDPEGANLAPGPEQYFQLLRQLGDALSDCLGS